MRMIQAKKMVLVAKVIYKTRLEIRYKIRMKLHLCTIPPVARITVLPRKKRYFIYLKVLKYFITNLSYKEKRETALNEEFTGKTEKNIKQQTL